MDSTSCPTPSAGTLHCALELSKKSWLLAIQFLDRPQPSLYAIEGGNTEKLMTRLTAARDSWAKMSGAVPAITVCYEVGYDAFWLARFLEERGVTRSHARAHHCRRKQASGPMGRWRTGDWLPLILYCWRIRRRLRPFVLTVVAEYSGHAQAVVVKDLCAALCLDVAVLRYVAEDIDSCVVSPERERDELAWLRDALEPLHRDEAVEPFERVAEPNTEIDIVLSPPRLRPGFEDYCNHGYPLSSAFDCAMIS
jgi:hypothetical protein